jgi:hypothetical protein
MVLKKTQDKKPPVKLKFLRNTIVDGEVIEAGKVLTVDSRTARKLIGAKKAEPLKETGKSEKATAPEKTSSEKATAPEKTSK